jgi:hypothetical protein
MILAKPLRAEQLSTAIRMTLSRPFLSGEAMWGQGLARVTRIAPIGGKTNREVDLVHRV